MKKGDVKTKRGFTIIEVSLVLAIAGLIFLMVFVALPSLQRGQRDARRRDDILVFLETVEKYQQNNRGGLPATNTNTWKSELINKYLNGNFVDPDGTNYSLSVKDCGSGADVECKNIPDLTAMDHILHIYVQATCKNSERVMGTSNPKNIAILYRLEGSGIYCANT